MEIAETSVHVDEILEEYLLDRLEDSDLSRVEEHLLFCTSCVILAEQLHRAITSLRVVTRPAARAAGASNLF